jgi:hypothetical protein
MTIGGALSDERTGLYCVRVGQQQLVGCQYIQLCTIYTLYMLCYENEYNIYKASVSPGSVKQIMPHV